MAQYNVKEVVQLAVEAGVPQDLFDGWKGHELALFEDTVGASATFEVASRIAGEKSIMRPWVLDLGNRAVVLPRSQGAVFRSKLDEAGIPYSTGDVSSAYLKRIHRITRDHEEILRELAKR